MSSLWIPARSLQLERMDREDNTEAALEAAVSDLCLVNRWFGGRRTLLLALAPYLRSAAHLSVLDVGTGGADLPLAMVRAGRAVGCRVAVTAIDRDPRIAEIARRAAAGAPEIRVVCADAAAPPFAPHSFDVVTASLFLHHVPPDEVPAQLRTLATLARRAVLINDLRRHRVAWALVHLFGRLTARNPMFLHDGPLSVLRAFTDAELSAAARAAGPRRFSVRRRWPFRLALTLELAG